jgi:hypothetical protein
MYVCVMPPLLSTPTLRHYTGIVLSMAGALGLLVLQLYLIGDVPYPKKEFFFSLPQEDGGTCAIPIWYLYIYFAYTIGVCTLVNALRPLEAKVSKGGKQN